MASDPTEELGGLNAIMRHDNGLRLVYRPATLARTRLTTFTLRSKRLC